MAYASNNEKGNFDFWMDGIQVICLNTNNVKTEDFDIWMDGIPLICPSRPSSRTSKFFFLVGMY